MKRKFLLPIYLGLGLLTLGALTSCSLLTDYIFKHEHIWTDYYQTNDNKHWRECQYPLCNAKKDEGSHISDDSVSCTLKPFCDVCNEVYGEPASHVYSELIAEDKYFSNEFNSDGAPLFYYMCECGAVNSEAYPYYGHYIYHQAKINPTCTEEGVESHYACYHCPDLAFGDKNGNKSELKENKIIPSNGHNYYSSLSYDEKEHYYTCKDCNDRDGVEAHVITSLEFSVNKNLTYGETYTASDLSLYGTCECGYGTNITDTSSVIIEEHVLEFGDNSFEVEYNGIISTIVYNPSSASNTHSDFENASFSKELNFEGVVTSIKRKNNYDVNPSFMILDNEGYGYFVQNPSNSNDKLSIGDYVSIKGKKGDDYYLGSYFTDATFVILNDTNEKALEDKYFVDATDDFNSLSNYQFARKYRYLPVIIKNTYIDQNFESEMTFFNDKYNSYVLNINNEYTTSLEYDFNRYSAITKKKMNMRGLLLEEGRFIAINGVKPYEYVDELTKDEKYNADNNFIRTYIYNHAPLISGSTITMPDLYFADEVNYYSSYGLVVDGNQITIPKRDGYYHYNLETSFYYDGDNFSGVYGLSTYPVEDYIFNYWINLYDNTYEWESTLEYIHSSRENTLDSYEVEVVSSYADDGSFVQPTVTVEGDYILVKPIDYYNVTNNVVVTAYYKGIAYSKEYKIKTMDNRFIREYYSIDFNSLSSNVNLLGHNSYKGLKLTLNDCSYDSTKITIHSGGSIDLYGVYDNLIYFSATIYSPNCGIEYYEGEMGNIKQYFVSENSSYDSNYYNLYCDSNMYRTISIVNKTSYDIELTYAYIQFLTYK